MESDWSDLRFVLETVRHGGVSGAARALGVNHATVSRRIASAEETLGAILFDRLPGGYAATPAGREAARAAEAMEDNAADLSRRIAARDTRLSGPLTVTTPQLLVEYVLAPILADFRAAHPDVELTILASNEPLNLARREADVAIRISDAPHETLRGVRVAEQRSAIYASRAYVERLLTRTDGKLDWIRFLHWTGVPLEIRELWPKTEVAMTLNEMVAVMGAVRAGVGATRMPCFLGDSDPRLVRLPDAPLFPYPAIWVLTHADMRRVRRLTVFTDFMAARLRRLRPLFAGDAP